MAAPFGWDKGQTYHTGLHPTRVEKDSRTSLEIKFINFLDQFRVEEHFIYRNFEGRNYYVDVSIEHLDAYDRKFSDKLKATPSDMMPLFESAVQKFARKLLIEVDIEIPPFQVVLRAPQKANIMMRELNADHISKLIRISGIVISATNLTSKATHVQIMCKTCRHFKMLPVASGFSGVQLPRTCDSDPSGVGPKDCGIDPFVIIHDRCTYVDQQVLKIQEAPDFLPVGDLPRHITVYLDRYLADRAVPGRRVNIVGIYDVFNNNSNKKKSQGIGTRIPYIRSLGLEFDMDQDGQGLATFTHAEEEEIIAMSRRPNFHKVFTSSIAPSIYGNHAITCLLFGGSKKILADKMKLRGDINVLLLGDPGTAKSQFLKFVQQVAPVAVYTSGKGSSAAGLTAAVVRDGPSREFRLEGGAMVLADGGVICIDEFDKMREEDRVAIHEAMEQQTISIAKAGITTILNSRTSVLAAANPIKATILSRFDMIFIVKDSHDERRDKDIAKHVMMVHMNRAPPESSVGEIDVSKMKKYISYARTRCAPRLSPEASEKLSGHFVSIRAEASRADQNKHGHSSIPITIRQLEAIIRISESMAKVTLSPRVTIQNVEQAMRLFKHSTMNALSSCDIPGMHHSEARRQIEIVEEEIKRRIAVGSRASTQRIIKEFERQFKPEVVQRAIDILARREEITLRVMIYDVVPVANNLGGD
ncbi:15947_t:CDS:10 [Funneliformis geosporum]|uniref:DNA replication licensing factor MCM5 n=1 Tax=Funneliformis geosporum TaxID=1117311 RepID=A0A9W4WPQ5_9GLOM|nr:15947_t:CDS:10 [Funneliformis geosporum]CAI2177774.1 3466_t:CDS:10 [Funneliformis geosporum]